MCAEDVLVFLDLAASIGVAIWLDGGWGVDALLGRQTRPHSDLDIAVEQRHVQALEHLLEAHDYRRVERDRERPWNFVLANSTGRRIDFHVVVLDDDGNGICGPPENGEQYPAAALTGQDAWPTSPCAASAPSGWSGSTPATPSTMTTGLTCPLFAHDSICRYPSTTDAGPTHRRPKAAFRDSSSHSRRRLERAPTRCLASTRRPDADWRTARSRGHTRLASGARNSW